MIRGDIIQWTGDNRDEMVQFCPHLLEWPDDYPDWPYIGIIGIKDGNVYRRINMRDYLVKSQSGGYKIIESNE